MTNYAPTASATSPTPLATLGDNEFAFIPVDIVITTTGAGPSNPAIAVAGANFQVTVEGSLVGAMGIFDTVGGKSGNVQVSSTGLIWGQYDGVSLSGSSRVINEGRIYGGGSAIALSGGPFKDYNVTTSGTLQSNSTLYGTINAITASSLYVQNTGKIENLSGGGAISSYGVSGVDMVINSGKIIGSVVLREGADLVDTRLGTLLGTIDLGAGNDTAYGSAGADNIIAGTENDLIRGGAGKDILDAGTGVDILDNTDRTQKVQVSLNGAIPATVFVNGIAEDSVKNFENVYGGSGGDVLTGDTFGNLLLGNAGNDTMSGGVGNDILRGGLGADVLDGGANVDTADYSDKAIGITVALAGATAVVVKVGAANEDSIKNFENVTGGTGADKLTGDALGNSFRGGLGKDTMDGGAGVDTADYSDKTQKVAVVLGGATAVAVTVNNVVEDTIKNFENITGGSAGDLFIGDGLNNVLNGGLGNDTMSGGGGNDVLIDLAGADSLTGGAGADHFRFLLGGPGTITDFVHGVDRIEFDVAGTSVTPINAANFASVASGNSGPEADDIFVYDRSSGLLWYDANGGSVAGGQILLAIVSNHPADLSAADLWYV